MLSKMGNRWGSCWEFGFEREGFVLERGIILNLKRDFITHFETRHTLCHGFHGFYFSLRFSMVFMVSMISVWFPWFPWFPYFLCGFHGFCGFHDLFAVSMVSMVSMISLRFPWFPWFPWFVCGFHGFPVVQDFCTVFIVCTVSMVSVFPEASQCQQVNRPGTLNSNWDPDSNRKRNVSTQKTKPSFPKTPSSHLAASWRTFVPLDI